MIDGLDKAQRAVQRQASREIDWFAPPGERHFDPASVVLAFAGLLLTSFLAGFTNAAKKTAENAGEQVFKWLAEQIRKLLSGQKPDAPQRGIDELAAEAPALARDLDGDSRRLYLFKAEDLLRRYLESSLPNDRAAAFSAEIRDAAVAYVLKTR